MPQRSGWFLLLDSAGQPGPCPCVPMLISQGARLGDGSVQLQLCYGLGYEEIEFSQLIFEDDFLNGSYFGGHLRGQIATEQLHFGEGVHRKAFRSTVMQGLMPVFEPGHACVLKVHNAVAYGTRNNDELIQRNYKLAAQVGPTALNVLLEV